MAGLTIPATAPGQSGVAYFLQSRHSGLLTTLSHTGCSVFQADARLHAGDDVPVYVDFQHRHHSDDDTHHRENREYFDGGPHHSR